MHVKIDTKLIPKEKKVSYFEAIKASENVGKGPYKLTRYKVWKKPQTDESQMEESEKEEGSRRGDETRMAGSVG